jgi:uncharacterized protein (TIGR02996 family)
MSDPAAFLDAIRAEPDVDLHRLAFADWLDERGDPYADLIRVQCELAELDALEQTDDYTDADADRHAALEARERRLWMKHGAAWLAGCWHPRQFRRGFVDLLFCGPNHPHQAEWDQQPWTRLQLYTHTRTMPTWVEDVARLSNLERLRELTLSWWMRDQESPGVTPLTPDNSAAIVPLRQFSQLAGVEALAISSRLDPLAVIDLLGLTASSVPPAWQGLRRLRAQSDGTAFLTTLARSPLAGQLTGLEFQGHDEPPVRQPDRTIYQTTLLGPRLTRVSLNAELTGSLLLRPRLIREQLVNLNLFRPSPGWMEWLSGCISLHTLQLEDPVHPIGFEHLTARRLRRVSLCHGTVTDATMEGVKADLSWRGVRVLELHNNPSLGDAGVEALVESGVVSGLTSLDLMATAVRLPGVQALARNPDLRRLRHLRLAECDDDCLRALAASPNLPNLTTLSVHGGRDAFRRSYTMEGLLAVAESERFPHLTALLYTELPPGNNAPLLKCLLSGRLFVGGMYGLLGYDLAGQQEYAARAGSYRVDWPAFSA